MARHGLWVSDSSTIQRTAIEGIVRKTDSAAIADARLQIQVISVFSHAFSSVTDTIGTYHFEIWSPISQAGGWALDDHFLAGYGPATLCN
jgi:hypothetical protein